jgi:diguanylate cyclase (GGDEF)-like protein
VGAGGAAILRLDEPTEAVVVGSWAERADPHYRVGDRFAIPPETDLAQPLPARRLGGESSIISPIKLADRAWGFLAIVSADPLGLTAEHERRLTEFGDLIATAVAHIEDRAALAAQAATDPLTGVANHRTFHERLTADLTRARRYGGPVSVAMIDVDRFKLVNDLGGHEAGDEMLISVARHLNEATRAADTLARVGGDEFAWILPETTGEEARVAVERARQGIRGPGGEMSRVTLSAGVCDSTCAADPTELVRLADRALYYSKEHGRDQVRLYAPSRADQFAAH